MAAKRSSELDQRAYLDRRLRQRCNRFHSRRSPNCSDCESDYHCKSDEEEHDSLQVLENC